MKILLLGHKGMLGNDLLTELDYHHDVTGMDMDEIDITSSEQCQKAIDDLSPEIVVNAAAYTNVDGCVKAKDASSR